MTGISPTPVTRFHFHLYSDDGYTPDARGRDLADSEAARRHGLKYAGQLICGALEEGATDVKLIICIETGKGERLMTLPMSAFLAA